MLQTNIQQHLHIGKEHCAALLFPGFQNSVGKGMLNETYLTHSKRVSASSFSWIEYPKLCLKCCIQNDALLWNRDTWLQEPLGIYSMGMFFGLGKEQNGLQKSWVEDLLAVLDGLPKDDNGIFRHEIAETPQI